MLPTTTVALTIRVDNDYAHGPTYTHLLNVDVPIPGDDINLTEWMLDHLFPYTGEDPSTPIHWPSIPSRSSVPQTISTSSLA